MVASTSIWSSTDIECLLGLYETHMNKLRSEETVNQFWNTIAMRLHERGIYVSIELQSLSVCVFRSAPPRSLI